MGSELRNLWTRAGGIAPNDWPFSALEDLLLTPKSISVGVMYPGSHVEGGIPLIKVGDVANGAVTKVPDFCISDKVDEEYKRTRLKGTELLLTLVGNPGDCVIATPEMAQWNAARALAVLTLEDPSLRYWLRMILLSSPSKHIIDARLNTTVQRTLNLKDVRQLPIPLPPKSTRDYLCNIAQTIEQKIQLNRQTNQTLEQMAQALFKSWFVDFDPVIDNALAAGNPIPDALAPRAELRKQQLAKPDHKPLAKEILDLFPSEFEETELSTSGAGAVGWVPKGWEVTELGELISVKHGYAFKGEFFCDSVTADVLLTPGNVAIGGGFKEGKFKYYNGPVIDEYLFNKGDLFINMTDLSKSADTLGYPAFVPEIEGTNFHHNQRLGRVDFHDKSKFGHEFIYRCLCSHDYRNHIVATATGTTVKHTSPTKILNYKVINSGGTIEALFEELTADISNKRELNNKTSRSLEKLRDTLLPKLISGELRLPETIAEAEQLATGQQITEAQA